MYSKYNIYTLYKNYIWDLYTRNINLLLLFEIFIYKIFKMKYSFKVRNIVIIHIIDLQDTLMYIMLQYYIIYN